MSKKTIVLVVLLALALLMATLWFGMRLGVRSVEQGTGGNQLAGAGRNVPPSLPAASAPALPLVQAQPPWAASAGGSNAAIPGVPDSAAQIERQKQMAELRTMQMALMKSMQETNRADPRQVDALLLKIKQVTGSSTFNGIDIDVLRNNLAKAEKMQRIAEEMNREASKPGGADPKKIQAYAEQLKKLQPQSFMTPQIQPKPAAEPAK